MSVVRHTNLTCECATRAITHKANRTLIAACHFDTWKTAVEMRTLGDAKMRTPCCSYRIAPTWLNEVYLRRATAMNRKSVLDLVSLRRKHVRGSHLLSTREHAIRSPFDGGSGNQTVSRTSVHLSRPSVACRANSFFLHSKLPTSIPSALVS